MWALTQRDEEREATKTATKTTYSLYKYVWCVHVSMFVCLYVCICQRRRPTSDTIISHVAFLVAAPTAHTALMVLAESQMWQVATACWLPHVGGLCLLLLYVTWCELPVCQWVRQAKTEGGRRSAEASYRQMLSNCHDNQKAYRYSVTRRPEYMVSTFTTLHGIYQVVLMKNKDKRKTQKIYLGMRLFVWNY